MDEHTPQHPQAHSDTVRFEQRLIALEQRLDAVLERLQQLEANSQPPIATPRVAAKTKKAVGHTNPPTISPELALERFELLIKRTKAEGEVGFAAIQAETSWPEALAMARELGFATAHKTKAKLWPALRVRVQQSLQLMLNTPRVDVMQADNGDGSDMKED
jgi:hypothetical protein